MASSCSSSCTVKYLITLSLVFAMYLLQNIKNCNAFQTFGFEMHHRFSDQVKAVIGGDDLPEIGSREYHAAMVHRDKVFRGLDSKLLTLSDGIEETSNIASLIGSLHYATVSLGTPSLLFLVALDTGTNLLWVPCDCATCTPVVLDKNPLIKTNLNIYNINSSSTSKYVPCNSSLCELRSECSKSSSQCPYQAVYIGNINSSGVLVEDVLRLKKEINKPKEIDARITFGCGQVQTGIYFNGTARSGLFGLGIGNTSVPSILSMQGLVANSFSMCFGSDWVGKIIFGDKGSSDLAETPLNPMQEDPWYNISVAQLSVGGNLSHHLLDVTAVFYSGSEYTYLNDPAYTALCDSFNSQTLHKRLSYDFDADFEYCYDVSSESTELVVPNVTLVMKGGSQFNVYNPMVPIKNDDGTVTAYCLGVIKSSKENFIGNNFMTGHHIFFDREKMVLGWKESNCTDEIVDSETQPRIPQTPKLSTPKNGNSETIKKKRNKVLKTTLLSVGSSILLFALIGCLIISKRRKSEEDDNEEMQKDDLELPFFDLLTIKTATNNFYHRNKIGQGGFGPVYKGKLEEGEEIAVKKLSRSSGQGFCEFRNEVILIAKLQHRNLVKLLGCCIQGKERMLVYEYMPNESLDYFIFDRKKGKLLNWEKRRDIVMGIARGLVYLHEDSRLRIIHRDLKASNILLDINMNPKISDFGMARLFKGDQIEANTERVVGTYGYMSPEYAIDGHFSTKSDVFSFGVLVLEIVSGKKNRGFYNGDHYHTLLGHAWMLWRDGSSIMELTDPCLEDLSSVSSEVRKCIQVGLLCVQQLPEDRPSMSSVVLMLGSENVVLPEPKQPGFFVERSCYDASTSFYQTKFDTSNSENQVSFSVFEGR